MPSIARPDLSDRPLKFGCDYEVSATSRAVFAAWTQKFDLWFAQPGTLWLTPEPGQPYFFYNRDEWGRHPHYGRLLDVKEHALVEMTWMTGNGDEVGTEGAETVLRIEMSPQGENTQLRLTHAGFASERSRSAHEENWPMALEILDQALIEANSK